MKSLTTICVFSAACGLGLGAVLAYVEVPDVVDRFETSKPKQELSATNDDLKFPVAEVPETLFKFGNIERGTSMSHVFKVRNIGTAPLRVEVASTTCKCTVGDLSKKTVSPGEETEVMLEWHAKVPPGPFRHGAVLKTNDPGRSTIELNVEGDVVGSTAMSPPELMLGSVRQGETASASLYVMSFLTEEPEVVGYKVTDDEMAELIDIEVTPATKEELPAPNARVGLKVTANFHTGKTVGPFVGWLTLETNLKKAQKLEIPIMGRVIGDVSIFGAGWNSAKGVLRMGSFPSSEGKKVSLKVALRGKDVTSAKLDVAEVDPPQLHVSVGDPQVLGDELIHVPVTVEVPPGSEQIVRMGEPVSSDAHIVLRSSEEHLPDIRLRVHFAVE